jgi:hypothetical protein
MVIVVAPSEVVLEVTTGTMVATCVVALVGPLVLALLPAIGVAVIEAVRIPTGGALD